MTGPTFEEQLLSLSPKGKMVAGAALGAAGLVACVFLWERGWIAWAAVFAALFGPTIALIGMREHSRAKLFDAEVQRAQAEWSDLKEGIHAARRDGDNVARFLQARGYREFAVRRWIAAELDPGKQAK